MWNYLVWFHPKHILGLKNGWLMNKGIRNSYSRHLTLQPQAKTIAGHLSYIGSYSFIIHPSTHPIMVIKGRVNAPTVVHQVHVLPISYPQWSDMRFLRIQMHIGFSDPENVRRPFFCRDLLFLSRLIFQLMFKSVPARAMFSSRLSAPRLITGLICYHFLQLFSLDGLMTQAGQDVEKNGHSKRTMWPRSTLVWVKMFLCVMNSLKTLDGLFIWPSAQFTHTNTRWQFSLTQITEKARLKMIAPLRVTVKCVIRSQTRCNLRLRE